MVHSISQYLQLLNSKLFMEHIEFYIYKYRCTVEPLLVSLCFEVCEATNDVNKKGNWKITRTENTKWLIFDGAKRLKMAIFNDV